MSEWQKIETAPKNNVILLTDGGYVVAGFWQSPKGWMAGWISGEIQVQFYLYPTHWMPLPEGPK